MIPSNSIDVIASNCVLNLIDSIAKKQMFAKLYRTLKPGGRAVISDIISSDDLPTAMQQDPNYGVTASAARSARTGFFVHSPTTASTPFAFSIARKNLGAL